MINDLVISQIRQRLEILYQMVDELETGGGGGGGGQGGVTDYNDLTSKPKIGGVTLQGDKSADSLGLATSTALNTLSATVNTLSGTVSDLFASDPVTISSGGTLPVATRTRVANHEPIYFNNGEYSGQYYFIEDEGSVSTIYATLPTSGSLPTITYAKIKRSTNKVEFYQTAVDTTPTSGSQDLITSGGVYTAIALETSARENADTGLQTAINSKASIKDIYGIKPTIPNGTDLNTMQTQGAYACGGATLAASLVNCPTTTDAFIMYVDYIAATSRIIQRLYTMNTTNGMCRIYIRGLYSGGWGTWYMLEGTAVT